jgi:hypothetical protein
MQTAKIYNLPIQTEKWKRPDELCPMCQKPFGHYKQLRLASDVTIHKHCAWGSAQVIAESSK